MRVLFAAVRPIGLFAVLAAAVSFATVLPAAAQDTIKIGEMNSYKSQPAFLEPYKKGWQMAVEEINAAGGVLGKKIEVISRDDGANPGDAVRAADELVTGEGVNILCGTFLSNVGLAVTEFAGKKKVFFLGAEALTDKMVWQNGNRYTFRLRRFDLYAGRDADAVRARGQQETLGAGLSELRIRAGVRRRVQANDQGQAA